MGRPRPRLTITADLEYHLKYVRRCLKQYVPGRDSASVIEIPKLQLADALLEAEARQRRIDRLPARVGYVLPVLEMSREKRKKRA